MLNVVFALVTVFAWGTWLAPSQHVPMKGQQTRTFYVTLAVLLVAIVAAFFQGYQGLTLRTSWLPFLGGIIWALSGLCAFVGTQRLGMAKAFGIWSPLNIIVSILWGIILFGEFLHTGTFNIVLAIVSFVVIIGGILMIIFAGSEGGSTKQSGAVVYGYLGALGAGIGWASYFIPIRISGLSMWVAMLPLAAGMFVGGAVICVVSKSSLHLEKPSHYMRVMFYRVAVDYRQLLRAVNDGAPGYRKRLHHCAALCGSECAARYFLGTNTTTGYQSGILNSGRSGCSDDWGRRTWEFKLGGSTLIQHAWFYSPRRACKNRVPA